jgi:radical SAM protein with 4Fe4S-binding SPASM domain
MIEIRRFALQLTRRCNLNCRYCYCDPHAHQPDSPLDLSALTTFIDTVKTHGVDKVVLTGGEPLLYTNIRGLLSHLASRDFWVALETNGLLLNAEILGQLSQGGGHVAITLESVDAEVHDSIRRKVGAWESAVAAFRLMKDFPGVSSQITFSLTPHSVEHIAEALALAEALGVVRVKLNPIYRIGPTAAECDEDLYLSPAGILDTVNRCRKHLEADYPFALSLAVPPALLPLPLSVNGANCEGCDLRGLIAVLHDGTIRPCHSFMYSAQHILGTIYQPYSIPDILRQIEAMPGSEAHEIGGVCAECLLLSSCRGFCRAVACMSLGATDQPNWLCQQLADQGLFPQQLLLSDIFGGSSDE